MPLKLSIKSDCVCISIEISLIRLEINEQEEVRWRNQSFPVLSFSYHQQWPPLQSFLWLLRLLSHLSLIADHLWAATWTFLSSLFSLTWLMCFYPYYFDKGCNWSLNTSKTSKEILGLKVQKGPHFLPCDLVRAINRSAMLVFWSIPERFLEKRGRGGGGAKLGSIRALGVTMTAPETNPLIHSSPIWAFVGFTKTG